MEGLRRAARTWESARESCSSGRAFLSSSGLTSSSNHGSIPVAQNRLCIGQSCIGVDERVSGVRSGEKGAAPWDERGIELTSLACSVEQ